MATEARPLRKRSRSAQPEVIAPSCVWVSRCRFHGLPQMQHRQTAWLTEESAFCALPQQATVSKAAMYCLPKQRKLPFARVLTGATGHEPATPGVTGRDGATGHSRLRPGISSYSRHFASERTGCDRLRPAATRHSLCGGCVAGLVPMTATIQSSASVGCRSTGGGCPAPATWENARAHAWLSARFSHSPGGRLSQVASDLTVRTRPSVAAEEGARGAEA
jgi:hypothetical protein